MMDYALKTGCPMVGFNDSGGARIQEGIDSLSAYGQVFFRNVLLSGVVPQIAIVAGPCAGGAAYSPALMDFIIMVKGSANMFICGPEVIQAVTGQKCTMDEIGSATTNASVSGNVHFIADNDAHAVQIVAPPSLLSALQQPAGSAASAHPADRFERRPGNGSLAAGIRQRRRWTFTR